MLRLAESGWVDTTSWLVNISEDFEVVQPFLKSEMLVYLQSEKRAYYALMTLFHESVHFWHSISTNFFYEYSVNYLGCCLEVLAAVKERGKRYKDLPLLDYEYLFTEMQELLVSKEYPLRNIDILEGCAVLCSYRMCTHHADHYSFLEHLSESHRGQPEYTAAYTYLAECLGEDAFDLFSPICYLSLQSGNPAKAFMTITQIIVDKGANLDKAKVDPIIFIRKLMPSQSWMNRLARVVAKSAATDPPLQESFLSKVKKMRDPSDLPHPILRFYAGGIVRFPSFPAEDFFARPYHYWGPDGITAEHEEVIFRLLPPISLWKDGEQVILWGITGKGSVMYQPILTLTFLFNLVPILVWGLKDKMNCPQVRCPVFKKKLCSIRFSGFFPDSWTKCELVKLFRDEEWKLDLLLKK